jgi:hypothetical protein
MQRVRRYIPAAERREHEQHAYLEAERERVRRDALVGGLYKSRMHSTHSFESTRFQPLNPSSEKLVSKFAASNS